MKKEHKANFKRALALFIALAVTASQPGFLAVAHATENTAVVTPDSSENTTEETLEEAPEEALEEAPEASQEEPLAEPEEEAAQGGAETQSLYDFETYAATPVLDATFSTIPKQYLTKDTSVVIAPDPTVKVDGVTLTKGKDYDLTYLDSNTTPGVKTLKITGKLNYTGEATTTYEIWANVSQGVANATPDDTSTVANT